MQEENQVSDYMESQKEIKMCMRIIIVEWLVKVHYRLELQTEALFLTINIIEIDRYLSLTSIPKRDLMLVAICSMSLANKYKEISYLKVASENSSKQYYIWFTNSLHSYPLLLLFNKFPYDFLNLEWQVNELLLLTVNSYSRHQFISMEKDIIKTLKWNLTVPTSYVFLVQFTGSSIVHDKER